MIKVDITKCTGCRMCETACSFYHSGAVNRNAARIQVINLYEQGIDGPVTCVQCKERYCLDCPTNAFTIGAQGQIIASPTLCTLCGKCERNCPIGAIRVFDQLLYVCDLCGGNPKCTPACTESAITYQPGQQGKTCLETINDKIKKKKLNTSEKQADYIRNKGESLLKSWRS